MDWTRPIEAISRPQLPSSRPCSPLSTHKNVKVFISSRTEDEIRNPFAKSMQSKHVKHMHLNTSDPSSIHDVSTFMLRGLKTIVEKHDLNWETWPGDRGTALGARASGLFIWAVTAVKFLQEQIDSNGLECLDDVLDILTVDALHDINTLYELILRVTLKDAAPEWQFERFRRIIGTIVFLREPLCLDDLGELLDLRKSSSSNPVDIRNFVRHLRTVLVTGTDDIDGKTIPRLHKSFFEFITSTRVNARFHVDPEYANLELAVQCLRQLSASHTAITKTRLPVPFRYACRFWSAHLSQTTRKTPVLLTYTQGTVPPVHPASPLPRPTVVTSLLMLDISLSKSRIQLTLEKKVRLWDISSGYELPRRHNESVSCLAFSPNGKQVVTGSTDKSILFWDASTGQWNGTSIECSSSVLTVSFSIDGKYVVSGSSDHTLCLWDAHTGSSVGSPFRGHKGPVTCVAFSPDGMYIISGSADKTCRVRDAKTGQSIGAGNAGRVSSVAHERASGYFQLGTDDGTIRCRRARDQSKSGENVNAHKKKVTSLACSSKDATLVSGSKDGSIRHWRTDHWTLEPISAMNEHEGAVLCAAFSPNGQHVFSGSNDTICVSTVGGARRITRHYSYQSHTSTDRGRRKVNPDQVTALAFSPDTRYFACAGLTVCVYELRFQEKDFQLDIIPINTSPLQYDLLRTPSTDATSSRAFSKELDQVLSSVEEKERKYDAEVRNGRLEGIQWFKPKDQSSNKGSSVLWALFDDHIVRTNSGDGSVTVWDRNGSS